MDIGVEAGQRLGLRKIFDRISSNLPEKFVCGNVPLQIFHLKNDEGYFWRSHAHNKLFFKKGLHVFFREKKSNSVSLNHHPMRTKVSKQLCPNFQGFCPDFRQMRVRSHPVHLHHWFWTPKNVSCHHSSS